MADAPAVATPSPAPAFTPAAAQPATAAPTAAPVNAAASAPSVTPAAEPASAAQATSPAQPATAPAAEAAPDKSLIGNRKPADAKSADGAKPAEPAKPDEPIKYELKLPEDIKVDEAQMAAVTGILGKAKVAPEIAQELADFHTGALKTALTDAGKAFLKSQNDVWNNTIIGWQNEVKADPQFGGNNFNKMKGEIDQGLLTYFNAHNKPDDSPEMKAHDAFVETLAVGGAGSRLAMLRFVHKAVSRGSEGKPVQGNGPSAPRKSAAELMYPQKQQAAE